MNKISKEQFTAVLLISDIFAMLCIKGSISAFTSVGFITGIIFSFALLIPFIRYCQKGGTFGKCGKFTAFLYLCYIIFSGSNIFSMIWNTSEVIYIPYENNGLYGKILISAVIAVSCIYISSCGIKALARSAVIAMSFGTLCIIIVTVSALMKSEWNNFALAENSGNLYADFIKGCAWSCNIGVLMVFSESLQDDITDSLFFYFTFKVLLFTVILLVTVLVSGGIMKVTDFPVVTSAQISQPFSVQRIDSLFLIVFSVFAVFSVAVQTSSAINILKEIFPNFVKFRNSAVLAVMILTALVPFDDTFRFSANVIFMFTAPVVYFLKNKNPLTVRG